VTYRAELSGRALKQMYGLPGLAFDSFIETLAYDTSLWAATCGWWIPPGRNHRRRRRANRISLDHAMRRSHGFDESPGLCDADSPTLA
jgi:hypothetical protein